MKDSKTKDAHAQEDEARIRELVEAESPYLKFANGDTKIVCVLNDHEIPVRLEALEAFVRCECMRMYVFGLVVILTRVFLYTVSRGKKYARLKRNKSVDDWTDEYRPFLVPSVNFPYVSEFILIQLVINDVIECTTQVQEYDVLFSDESCD